MVGERGNLMSKQKYRIDMAKRVIYVDANYLKLSQNPKTRAYATISELIAMQPTFEVKAEGIAKDRYNHLTYKTMENFFTKNGLYDALEELNQYRNDKTVVNKNGRNIRVHNMGAIRSWFIKHYGTEARKQGYLEQDEDKAACPPAKNTESNNAVASNKQPVITKTENDEEPKTSQENDVQALPVQLDTVGVTEETVEKKGA